MVVVGIVGPQQSGKKSVARVLQKLHGFAVISIDTFVHEDSENKKNESNKVANCVPNGTSHCDANKIRIEAAMAVMDHCKSHGFCSFENKSK